MVAVIVSIRAKNEFIFLFSENTLYFCMFFDKNTRNYAVTLYTQAGKSMLEISYLPAVFAFNQLCCVFTKASEFIQGG